MTFRMKHLDSEAARSILRVSAVIVFAGLLSCSARAADDLVLKWNEIAAQTTNVTSPFNQARIMTITQLAVFEAANAVTGEYEPYLTTPAAALPGASVDAAVVTAAHKVLTNYFSTPATVALLDAARDSDLATIPSGPAKTAGIAVGLSAATAMIALRVDDKSATPPLTTTPSTTGAGDYQLTTGMRRQSIFQLAECDAIRHP